MTKEEQREQLWQSFLKAQDHFLVCNQKRRNLENEVLEAAKAQEAYLSDPNIDYCEDEWEALFQATNQVVAKLRKAEKLEEEAFEAFNKVKEQQKDPR